MKRILIAGCVLLLTLGVPYRANALLDEYIEEVDFTIDSTTRYFLEADIANDVNEISVFESRFDVEIDINPEADISWELDFINKNVFLDSNTTAIDLPAMLVGRSMRLGVKFPMPFVDDSDYRFGAAVVPTYNTDSWKDSFDDFESGAFRWISEWWVDYRGTDPFAWKLGVKILPEHEDVILPIIEMTYEFADNWFFRLQSDDVGLVYRPNESWEFFTEFRYVLDEFEITTGGIEGRVLRQKQNPAGLGVQYNINGTSYLKAVAGWGINRLLEFEDNVNDDEIDIDSAPYFTLELVWNF